MSKIQSLNNTLKLSIFLSMKLDMFSLCSGTVLVPMLPLMITINTDKSISSVNSNLGASNMAMIDLLQEGEDENLMK